MASKDQLEDVLDARAEIRTLRNRVNTTKADYLDAKMAPSAAAERLEGVLTELEQKKGRLPLDGGPGGPKRPRPAPAA